MDLFEKTPGDDLRAFTCRDDDGLAGCVMASRLRYPEDNRTVFLLAPVAVETGRQRRGIGRKLLRIGLDDLRRRGVDVALTYGDPACYDKVGFAPITDNLARAPLALQFPHGWLGQSLTERPLDRLRGPLCWVEALNSPAYW
ncbi:hypothetical protein GCM10011358_15590 [Sinisalibacter lacisalsi]|uniref:N-acetyltransferase domain-containing protein n=2 Tax=Sinisalibacter lacisalsi TaxID=1526570 RepID=A0ABQ1QN68_9RHOB|nr:hypothetical protein GCM10011358_15590 [Sinisalibacter lacisalsi]